MRIRDTEAILSGSTALIVWTIVLSTWLIAAGSVVASPAADLAVHLWTDKSEYALGEPLRFRVVLANRGGATVRIPHISDLGSNTRFLYFEVTSGEHKRLHSTRVITIERAHGGYAGEPLAPEQEVTAFLYPHETDYVDADRRDDSVRRGLMFPDAGRYTVRVFYKTGALYSELWQPQEPGGVASNAVVIDFRAPSDSEREILRACWSFRSVGAELGEMNAHAGFDEGALRRVLTKYPDVPLADYARYCLARSLTRVGRGGIAAGASEGIVLFEELRRTNPDFRREEITKQLATAYFLTSQGDAALKLFEEGLRAMPYLYHHYAFMARYVHARTGDPIAAQEWLGGRVRGQRLPAFVTEE